MVLLGCGMCFAGEGLDWTVMLEQPGKVPVEIGRFDGFPSAPIQFETVVDGIRIAASVTPEDELLLFHATAGSAETDRSCFLSLKAGYDAGTAYCYDGAVKSGKTFRQSPHDPLNHGFKELIKQAVPMVAVKTEAGFTVAVSDTPAFYENFTTQRFEPENKAAVLCFGDDGRPDGSDPSKAKILAYYHPVGGGNSKTFEGIIFQSAADDVKELRRDVMMAVSRRWGDGVDDRFGATAFASNYMLLRKNEKPNSTYWVVPGIVYANKQYSRDAFWQSMVLPPEFSRECYLNEAVDQTPGAERPLFCMIWAYRTRLEGGEPDMEGAKKTLAYIEEHSRDGWYYSSYTTPKGIKKQDYQSWYDTVAFEDDDVITYNQGLFAVALMSAEALGLKPSVSSSKAVQNYRSMFNDEGGYFPLSRQKNLLAVDPLVGDLLAQLYFKKPLLTTESVISHFNQVVSKAKTQYGYKVTCLPNGDYAPVEAYSSSEHTVTWTHLGHYQWGGSWYLYDMLCLIDSYLHGAPGALEEIKWRGALDFKLGGTYFEHNSTSTGKPDKENQGWDAAVYAIWKDLIEEGKADDSFFREIDQL
jgi:hypothetical protein